MRVSPVAHAFQIEKEVLEHAERTAECTHNHPGGIKGAQATAFAVFLARSGADKDSIRSEIQRRFGYDLSQTIDAIRPDYRIDLTCQGSVPEAIIAFLDWISARGSPWRTVSVSDGH
jgi:ADP-ribosylglycohydrolase